MVSRGLLALLLVGGVCTVAVMLSCADSDVPNPKKTVIALFGAMEKNDQSALTYLLDLPELMRNANGHYALQTDSARVWSSPQQILDDLTGDGATKQTWFSLQRIVSRTDITSETTATVDVTFVNKKISKGYLTKFGLHLVNGKWKIYSFELVQAPN